MCKTIHDAVGWHHFAIGILARLVRAFHLGQPRVCCAVQVPAEVERLLVQPASALLQGEERSSRSVCEFEREKCLAAGCRADFVFRHGRGSRRRRRCCRCCHVKMAGRQTTEQTPCCAAHMHVSHYMPWFRARVRTRPLQVDVDRFEVLSGCVGCWVCWRGR